MGRKICLVGFSELSRDWANEQPEDVEIWGMNEAHVFLERWDRWFQLHPRKWNERRVKDTPYFFGANCMTRACGWEVTGNPHDQYKRDWVHREAQRHADRNPEHEVWEGPQMLHRDSYGRTPAHLRWLSECGIPVYQIEPDPRIPTAVRFPLEEIGQKLGVPDVEGYPRPYLTSTSAFMIALALLEHVNGDTVDEIRTAGIELLIGTEFARQKPCFEWWLGLAMGMGVKWIRPPGGNSLLTDAIYGVDYMETPQDGSWFPVRIERGTEFAKVNITEPKEEAV